MLVDIREYTDLFGLRILRRDGSLVREDEALYRTCSFLRGELSEEFVLLNSGRPCFQERFYGE